MPSRDPWLPERLTRYVGIITHERKLTTAAHKALIWLLRHTATTLGDRPQINAPLMDTRDPAWRDTLSQTIIPAVEDTFGAGWRLAMEGALYSPDPATRQYLTTVDNRLIRVADEVFDVIRAAIEEGRTQGESIPEITERVDQILQDTGAERWRNRARVIARTETIGAYNAGHHTGTALMAAEIGVDLADIAKEWLWTHDDRTRPTHKNAVAPVKGMGTPFTVGGFPLQRPGDPTGPPQEVIQCRCTVLFHFPGDPAYPATLLAGGPPMTTTEAELTTAATDDCKCDDPDWGTPEQRDDCDCGEDETRDEKMTGEAWFGVLAPEATMSGDRRRFETDSLRHRDFPLPLSWQEVNAERHDGSVVVGRIDGMSRIDGRVWGWGVMDTHEDAMEATRRIDSGFLRGVSVDVDDVTAEIQTEDGEPWVDPLSMLLGLDAEEEDIDMEEVERRIEEQGEPVFTVTDGRVAGATLCPIPAFQEAFITLGEMPENPVVPQELLAAGHPAVLWTEGMLTVAEVYDNEQFVSEKPWDGAASRFTDSQWKRSCVLHVCSEDTKSCHKLPIREPGGALNRAAVHNAAGRVNQVKGASAEQKASAKASLRGAYKTLGEDPPDAIKAAIGDPSTIQVNEPAPAWRECDCHSADSSALVASAAPVDWFINPNFEPGDGRMVLASDGTWGCPHTVTPDGWVYGTLAKWGACHTTYADTCMMAPKSKTNYAYFRTGELECADGLNEAVGQITMGTGHAAYRLRMPEALAHYDNTGTVVADIVCGDDAYGIWYTGQLREGLSAKRIKEFKAAQLSGDWRRIGGRLELVAALAVNAGGYPMPRIGVHSEGGRPMALVAAGMMPPRPPTEGASDTVREVLAALDRRERVMRAATTMRGHRLARLEGSI